jgi:hypothetical protein
MKKLTSTIKKIFGISLIFIGVIFFISSADQIRMIFNEDFWYYNDGMGKNIFGFMDLLTWQIVFAIILFMFSLVFVFFGYKNFKKNK